MKRTDRIGTGGGRAVAGLCGGLLLLSGVGPAAAGPGAPGAAADGGAPRVVRTYFDVGRELIEQGRMREGMPYVAAAAAVWPRRYEVATYLLAVLDGPKCRNDLALHEAVLAVLPNNRALLERTAALDESAGRYAEAGALRLRAADVDPASAEAQFRLGDYFRLLGAERLAQAAFARYVAMGGDASRLDGLPLADVPGGAADAGSLVAQAAAGDATAMFVVGRTYLVQAANAAPDGRHEAGLAYLEASARAGFTPARRFLAALYLEGRQVPLDPARGVAEYELAAAEGDALARRTLADMYYEGRGVPVNLSRAAYWYQRALSDPDPGYRREDDWTIRLRLARLYRAGDGVERDSARARALLEEAAAEAKAPQVLQALADAYAAGEGGAPAGRTALATYFGAASGYLDRGFLYGVTPDDSQRQAHVILTAMERIDPQSRLTRQLRQRLAH